MRERLSMDAGCLPSFTITRLTRGPKHHFFGYYGVTPWNASQRRMVCLESDFHDRLPAPDEAARISVLDPESREIRPVGETRAWNLQQGAMLHWCPLDTESEVVFNDRRQGGEVVAAVLNVETGAKRFLPRPVSAVARRRGLALSLTYGRLTRLRPVVGYPGAVDPNPDDPHPDNDGVFRMDLTTGETGLIVSIGEVYRHAVKVHPPLEGRHLWFNHTVLNPSDKRLFFLARSWDDDGELDSAMYTVNVDGSDLRLAIPWGGRVSHFDWRTDSEIIATFLRPGDKSKAPGERKAPYLFTDGKNDFRRVGEGFLYGSGHCTFAPGGEWLAMDGSASTLAGSKRYLSKSLEVFNVATGKGVLLGTFNQGASIYASGDMRCDLHPRWNRSGDAICFDALDASDWTRQLHAARLEI